MFEWCSESYAGRIASWLRFKDWGDTPEGWIRLRSVPGLLSLLLASVSVGDERTRTEAYSQISSDRVPPMAEDKTIISRDLRVDSWGNSIRLRRYNWVLFFPCIFFQVLFQPANLYFFIIGTMQLVPSITESRGLPLTWMPLGVVMGFSLAREFCEELKRHQTDRTENGQKCDRLDGLGGCWRSTEWSSILPGDLLLIHEGQHFPCDLLQLKSSMEGSCLIETKQLDGETNLKSKCCPEPFDDILEGGLLETTRLLLRKYVVEVDVEPPNEDMFAFEGSARLRLVRPRPVLGEPSSPSRSPLRRRGKVGHLVEDARTPKLGSVTVVGETILDMSHLLPRGTSLQNTQWVIGMALYTGDHTKLYRNNRKRVPKATKLKRFCDRHLLYIFFLQMVMAFYMALQATFTDLTAKHPYLFAVTKTIANAPASLSAWGEFTNTLGRMILLTTYLVPISLTVQVELAHWMQAVDIEKDPQMTSVDFAGDVQCAVNSVEILDDLGLVSHVFSDKTGTLTKNEMKLQALYAAGKFFGSLHDDPISTRSRAVPPCWRQTVNYDGGSFVAECRALLNQPPGDKRDETLDELRDFLRALALCHTVLPRSTAAEFEVGTDGSIFYELERRLNTKLYDAASPDELALACGAAQIGLEILFRRGPKSACLGLVVPEIAELFGKELQFEARPPFLEVKILEVFPFDNMRKRMSVVIQDEDGVIRLLCKGADSAILPTANTRVGLLHTSNALKAMSTSGLRILVFAQRVLTADERSAMSAEFCIAKAEGCDALSQFYDSVECNLQVLGVTGIQDTLQDNCEETIASILAAGIKMWVLTGDKLETALSIAQSTSLIRENTFVNVVDGETSMEVKKQLSRCLIYLVGARQFDLPSKTKTKHDFLAYLKCTPEFQQTQQRKDAQDFGESENCDQLLDAIDSYLENFNATRRTRIEALSSAFSGDVSAVESRPTRTCISDFVTADSQLRKKTEELKLYNDLCLVITGAALKVVLEEEGSTKLLFALAHSCSAVLACRVSASQKGKLVELAGGYYENLGQRQFTSFAIGDGSNDINMLMSSHVGVGIKGREGSQAANAADVWVTEFSHIRQLLLIHGHEALRRNSFMIYFTLWKNVFFGSVAFWYSLIFSVNSAVDVFNPWMKQLYNIAFTCMPVMLYTWFDRVLPYRVMFQYPQLYPTYSRPDGKLYFGGKWFFWWLASGIFGSLVVVIVPVAIVDSGIGWGGRMQVSFQDLGMLFYTCIVIIVNLGLIPFHNSWTFALIWTYVGTFLAFFSIWAVTAEIPSFAYYGSISYVFGSAQSIVACILTTTTLALPLTWWILYKNIFHPSRQTIIQERMRMGVHDLIVGPAFAKETGPKLVAPERRLQAFCFSEEDQVGASRLEQLRVTA